MWACLSFCKSVAVREALKSNPRILPGDHGGPTLNSLPATTPASMSPPEPGSRLANPRSPEEYSTKSITSRQSSTTSSTARPTIRPAEQPTRRKARRRRRRRHGWTNKQVWCSWNAGTGGNSPAKKKPKIKKDRQSGSKTGTMSTPCRQWLSSAARQCQSGLAHQQPRAFSTSAAVAGCQFQHHHLSPLSLTQPFQSATPPSKANPNGNNNNPARPTAASSTPGRDKSPRDGPTRTRPSKTS